MNAALAQGQTDLIGIARPFAFEPPEVLRQLCAGTLQRPLRTPSTNLVERTSSLSALNDGVEAAWYTRQIARIGGGLQPDDNLSRWFCVVLAVPKYFVHPRWLRRLTVISLLMVGTIHRNLIVQMVLFFYGK
jgi:hypothetical protein